MRSRPPVAPTPEAIRPSPSASTRSRAPPRRCASRWPAAKRTKTTETPGVASGAAPTPRPPTRAGAWRFLTSTKSSPSRVTAARCVLLSTSTDAPRPASIRPPRTPTGERRSSTPKPCSPVSRVLQPGCASSLIEAAACGSRESAITPLTRHRRPRLDSQQQCGQCARSATPGARTKEPQNQDRAHALTRLSSSSRACRSKDYRGSTNLSPSDRISSMLHNPIAIAWSSALDLRPAGGVRSHLEWVALT